MIDKDKIDDDTNDGIPSTSAFRVFSYASKFSMALFFVAILFAITMGFLTPLMLIAFSGILEQMVNSLVPVSANATSNITAEEMMANAREEMLDKFYDEMVSICSLILIIGVAAFVCGFFQMSFITLASEMVLYEIRKASFKSILRQDIGWFDHQQTGKLITKNTIHLESIRKGISDKIALAVQMLTIFFTALFMAYYYGPRLALIMTCTLPFLAVAGWAMSKFAMVQQDKNIKGYGKAGGMTEQAISAIRTVVAFSGEEKEIARYDALLGSASKASFLSTVVQGFSIGFFMLVMFTSYALAFWFGQKEIASGNLSVSDVMIVFFGVLIGAVSLGQAFPHLADIVSVKKAFSFIYYIINREPVIDAQDDKLLKLGDIEGSIEFQSVDFHYPTRPTVKVLHDFSLMIKPGQTVALVGSSGSGKSTCVSLIERFYDPTDGAVLLDRTNINKLNVGWLRDQIGFVSQEPILFSTSIRENVAYGKEGATNDEIIKALQDANAYTFVKEFPNGLDTVVGERGCKMSGGQKQRIAIARAIIKNPKILLLDEATSALDTESERIVQEALDKARKGRTTIVIAHRLSTIKDADLIVAMEQGVAKEFGTHSELMEAKGLYWDLVNLQNLEIEDREAPTPVKNGGAVTSDVKVSITANGKVDVEIDGDETPAEVDVVVKEDLPGFGALLSLNKPEFGYIALACIFAIGVSGSMPLFAIFFAEMMEVFALPPDEMEEEAVTWCLMFFLLGVISFVCLTFEFTFLGRSGTLLTRRLRYKSYKSMLSQDMSYFDDEGNSTGALTTTLAQDTSLVQGATGIRLKAILEAIIALIVGLIIAFIFGWQLALLILLLAPLIMVAGGLEAKFASGFQYTANDDNKTGGKIVNECISNIRTLHSLNLGERKFREFLGTLQESYKKNKIMSFVFGTSYGFSQTILFGFYAVAFWFSAWLVQRDYIDGADSQRVIFSLIFAVMSIGQGMAYVPDFAKAQKAANDLIKLFNKVPLIDNLSTSGATLTNVQGTIKFENVQFRYPSRIQSKVLRGINLTVEPGQTVALVGHSGCGKSTLFALALRFYDPEAGAVYIDGQNIKDVNVKSLRQSMAIVSQEPLLFNASISENVRYGAISDSVTQEEIENVCKEANIHSFIKNLKDGYDTNVGERGTQLSGGQKQRIAIARALIRQPKILLLDEATSALDSESEKIVQETLDKASASRTCLVIAHRLSTIQNANKIVVIDKGLIAEEGTHEQLLSQKGLYYRYCQAQSLK